MTKTTFTRNGMTHAYKDSVSLITQQVNVLLGSYQKKRTSFLFALDDKATASIFSILFTGLLGFLFFRFLYRNPKLTQDKLNAVDKAKKEISELSEAMIADPSTFTMDSAKTYLVKLNMVLVKLKLYTGKINSDYGKSHLTRREASALGTSKTFKQSLLSNTIESCEAIISTFYNNSEIFPTQPRIVIPRVTSTSHLMGVVGYMNPRTSAQIIPLSSSPVPTAPPAQNPQFGEPDDNYEPGNTFKPW
jgi:hypothetical protein